jgi:uroporphyrinogen decarboxylase
MRTKSKRAVIESLIQEESRWDYIPAAFFTHFSNECHSGNAAVKKHIEYFRYTDMDFVKIQYEKSFPKLERIRRPKDWLNMPYYTKTFFEEPLEIIKGLVKELKRESLIVQTIYSPFMCAADSASYEVLIRHLEEDPESVKKGLSVIHDSILGFIRECVKMGVDGFYASTQGGEAERFRDVKFFQKHVLPFDISLLQEMNKITSFNILHICDYWLPYDSVDLFVDYPCHVISLPTKLRNGNKLKLGELYKKFGKPILGGLDRRGAISTGPKKKVEQEVKIVLSESPARFLLGADCTVANANWDILKFAIALAHSERYYTG